MACSTALSTAWTIQEILERWPAAGTVLLGLRMACAGCDMAPFETLAEAAASYGHRPEDLHARLEQAIGQASQPETPCMEEPT